MISLIIDNEYFIDVATEYQTPLTLKDAALMMRFLEIDGHKDWRLPVSIERLALHSASQVRASSTFEMWWQYNLEAFYADDGFSHIEGSRMVIPVRTIGKRHE